MDNQKNNKVVKISVVVLVLVVAYFGYFKYSQKERAVANNNTNQVEIPGQTTDGSVTPVGQIQYAYKDGTYDAIGTYSVPSGTENVSVELVIKNDTVTDAKVSNMGERPESKEYQNKFISGYKTYVVGKKIDQISVTKVSGSSLTPKGFMNALSKIKQEAKA